jgi:3-deoxy-D-manno-octulosonic-acid transferase
MENLLKRGIRMYFIYRIIIIIVSLFYMPVLVFQMAKGKYQDGLFEKFGFLPHSFKNVVKDKPTIWIQAASVGETMAAEPLVEEIQKKYPDYSIVFSTMTETGRNTAKEKYKSVDEIIYFPFDIYWIVKRVIKIVDPDIVILIETELWPEFIKQAKENGSKLMVASGRISEGSIGNYKFFKPLMKKILSQVDQFSMQTEIDAERIKDLGAPQEIVGVNGNIKFDRDFESGINKEDELKELYKIRNRQPVFVAGSTHDDEENKLVKVYNRLKKSCPDSIMILAPRYPKRIGEIEKIYHKNGIDTVKRTEIEKRSYNDDQVIIVDTIGELVDLYGIADLVFVGGSLIERGGHNILEPAAQGRLPFFGPHMFNFKKDTKYMLANEAAVQVENVDQLADEIIYYINNKEELLAGGDRAQRLIEKNKGAAERNLKLVDKLLATKKRKQILLIRLSAMGDVIHALPIAHAVRKNYPEAEISWIVEGLAKPLVEINPYIDNVIHLPKDDWKEQFKVDKLGALKECRDYFVELKRYDFDLAIDVHGLFKSAFTAKASGADKIYGPEDGRELSTYFYSDKLISPSKRIHQIERNLSLLKGIGIETNEVNFGIEIDSALETSVKNLLEDLSIDINKPLVVINPITTWETKNWFKDRYSKLADKLIREMDCQVIFTGGPADREDINDIFSIMDEDAINLAGKTDLQELAGLYDKSDLFIGGDTGPMHLAAAVDLPVLAIMGPTDPLTHGPYGDGHIVVQADIPCINCWNKKCSKENLKCMKQIATDDVYQKAEKMLN